MNKGTILSGLLLLAGAHTLQAAAGPAMRRLTQAYGQMVPRIGQQPVRQSITTVRGQPLLLSGQRGLKDLSARTLLKGHPIGSPTRAFACPVGMQQRFMSTAPSWWSNPLTYGARKAAYEEEQKREALTSTIFGQHAALNKRALKEAISTPGAAQRVESLMEANPSITPEAVASLFATATDVHNLLQSKEGVALADMLSAKNPTILIDMLRRMRGGAPNEMFGSVIDSYGTLIADFIRYNGDAFAQLLKHNPEAAQEIVPGIKDYMFRVHSWGLPSANFMYMLKQNNADVLPLIAADIDEPTVDRIITRARPQAHYFLTSILANPESEKVLEQKLDVAILKKRLHDLYVSTAPDSNRLSDFTGTVRFFYKANPYLIFNYNPAVFEKNSADIDKNAIVELIAPGSSPEQINMAYDMLVYRFNPERYVNEREKQKATSMLEQLSIVRDAATRGEPIDEALMQRLAESR